MSDLDLDRKLDATRAAVVVLSRELRAIANRIARLERLLASQAERQKPKAA